MTAADTRRPRALVLHDDRRLAAHIDGLLVAEGYAVEITDSALRMLGRELPPPRLLVLAATAVERRDRDLVPLLRELAPAATIVVLFPPNLRDVAAAMLAAGADTTLAEPFYPSELTAHARRALAGPAAAPSGPLASGSDPLASSPVAPSLAAPSRADAPPFEASVREATPVQQIAVGVAHAVRNPLQIMELMLASAEAGDELDLEALRGLMTRIADVAADLARFSDHTRSTPMPVELQPLLHEVFDPIPRKAAPAVVVDAPSAVVVVTAETELLRSALEILRDRALRETPRDGAIEVRIRVEGDVAEVSVKDGGQTPDDTALRHFFEPDPDVGVVQAGTWLEMAALAGIVQAQGGSVGVAGGPENGVTVTIRLATSGAGDDAS